MVYKIFNDGNEHLERGNKQVAGPSIKMPKIHIRPQSLLANILIVTIRLMLFIYDLASYPVYFIIQRPDRRAQTSQRIRSEQVDANTWIRTNQRPNEVFYGLPGQRAEAEGQLEEQTTTTTTTASFMGSTLSEIFANSVRSFDSRPCLGYRAVVSCPVLVMNEEGRNVLQDKSFRSDFTWYTYGQIGRRVQDISSGLYFYSIYPTSRALFMASTCLEWFCTAQACFQLAVQLVVAPDITDKQALHLVLREAQVEVIFVSCERLGELCQLLDVMRSAQQNEALESLVRRIVIIDWQFSVDFNDNKAFVELGRATAGLIESVLSIGQVEEAGIENPIELSCSRALSDEQHLIDEALHLGQPTHHHHRHHRKQSTKDDHQRRRTSNNLQPKHSDGQRPPLTAPLQRRKLATSQMEMKAAPISSGASNSSTTSVNCSTALNDSQNHLSTSPKPHHLAMVVYTYGSLGQIKPIMLTHQHLARSGRRLFLDHLVGASDVHLTTISLDNLIEFMAETCVFSQGGSIGYSSTHNTLFYDGNQLFARDKSDLEALGPTFLLARPYLLERLRTSVHNYLQLQMNPLTSFVLKNVLFEYKKYWALRHFGTPIVDRLFCSQLNGLFGPNLKYILCNGATDCSETKDFFAFMLNIPIIEIYGPDEAIASLISVNDVWDFKRRRRRRRRRSSATTRRQQVGENEHEGDDDREHLDNDDDNLDDLPDLQLMPPKVNKNTFKRDLSKNLLMTSSLLCPTMGTRVRLENWEEFRVNDQPYPRGRLVIGGDVVCGGYLNRAGDVSGESFFRDTNQIDWFRTGDIARAFPNGSFEIISAITDIIKMVDGQFISLGQIEHILRNSQFVENVCAICGEDRRFVINLVVPNLRRLALKSPGEANLKMAIGSIGMEPEPEELTDVEFRREVCNDRLLCEFVAKHLGELLAGAGLGAIPNTFLLVPEIWTPDTELVTASFEPKRGAIEKYYASDIRSMLRLQSRASSQRLSSRLARRMRLFQCPSPGRPLGASHTSINSI